MLSPREAMDGLFSGTRNKYDAMSSGLIDMISKIEQSLIKKEEEYSQEKELLDYALYEKNQAKGEYDHQF